MSIMKALVCLALVCIVPALSQGIRFPTQLEIKVALENPDTVMKALQCIEGGRCDLPYGKLLQRAGPELVTRGRCPFRMCTREQEQQARRLIVEIQQRYPTLFYRTINRLTQRG
ncbi:uncharacterized protein [Palaemon carinicauda]|uniref:uncharacterized protein n=1 Tax=Palaemon carinicauda TaxID=392227 RepID=UPI0035B68C55